MKVLFAVNNESISESIIKKYQQEYKEIISVKNVYYFNAIIKELQRDKTYDRIVISEDLQPFSNNNYDAIDKFVFEKMDNISDEATNLSGNDIPIILICTDRRAQSEPLLVKLFGIGVYNALLGKDRSITNVCELLAKPRSKKEAKAYYRIDSEDVDYNPETEGNVTEVEIQNILNYYKRLGGNEQKYVESFEHIASQYTDSQLRLIAKFLPLNVKAVLEANSLKYQEIVSFGTDKNINIDKTKTPYTKQENKYNSRAVKPNSATSKLDFFTNQLSKNRITEPVVIPSGINTANVRKMPETTGNIVQPVTQAPTQIPMEQMEQYNNMPKSRIQNVTPAQRETVKVEPQQIQEIDDILENLPTDEGTSPAMPEVQEIKRGRGRPRKVQPEPLEKQVPTQKRGRGRPKKVEEPMENMQLPGLEDIPQQQEDSNAPLNLFELGDNETDFLPSAPSNKPIQEPDNEGMILPGLDDDDEISTSQPAMLNNEPEITGMHYGSENTTIQQGGHAPYEPTQDFIGTNSLQQKNTSYSNSNLSGLLTKDKKIVAFVGTSKNGTSFLVNNVAELLSQKGINTAILDLTKNKNAYYIYTENEEPIRKIAYSCIENLRRGNPQGIQVHKNLTVYTTLPEENQNIDDYGSILQTLIQNYSLVILDCDFDTDYGYFSEAQELYLVQSFDVLTIQPLTAFLRNLKAKNILSTEKIRIILNKAVKLRGLTDKTIIGGMAFYNDPSMSFMTELFNKELVTYCIVPFEEQAYAKYLEGLVNCKITLNGYSKGFMSVLSRVGDMVYPLINNNMYNRGNANYNNYNNYNTQNNNFSSSMNNTLDRMKNNY